MQKKITIVTPCYNEKENIIPLYLRVKQVFDSLPKYSYNHLFIDNHSIDGTIDVLKNLALKDKSVQVIINTRNFGVIRSNFYALCVADGNAIINLVADGQDPPELIYDFLKKWEDGFPIVVGVKKKSAGSLFLRPLRKIFYWSLSLVAEVPLIRDFTGLGLYDKKVIDIMKSYLNPLPYFRGMVVDLGLPIAVIKYDQPERWHGRSTASLSWLLSYAFLGLTTTSSLPLRFPFYLFLTYIFLLTSLPFVSVKTLFIFNFLYIGVILFCLFVISEYLKSIHTILLKRPLVVEKERFNFSGDQ